MLNTTALPVVALDARRSSYLIVRAGRKYLHAVAMGPRIDAVKLDPETTRELIEARLHDKPYPPRRCARTYLRSGLPRTKRATTLLRAVLRGEKHEER